MKRRTVVIRKQQLFSYTTVSAGAGEKNAAMCSYCQNLLQLFSVRDFRVTIKAI